MSNTEMPETIWAIPAQPHHGMQQGVWDDERDGQEGETEYRRADLPPTRAQIEAMVPELVWDWPCRYGLICRAETSIGTYSIHADEDSAGGAILCYLHLNEDGDCTRYAVERREYWEPEEMQKWCQADYTRRICDALLPQGGE